MSENDYYWRLDVWSVRNQLRPICGSTHLLMTLSRMIKRERVQNKVSLRGQLHFSLLLYTQNTSHALNAPSKGFHLVCWTMGPVTSIEPPNKGKPTCSLRPRLPQQYWSFLEPKILEVFEWRSWLLSMRRRNTVSEWDLADEGLWYFNARAATVVWSKNPIEERRACTTNSAEVHCTLPMTFKVQVRGYCV